VNTKRTVRFCFICEWVMVCNATFNNISVISWRSVLLVEETGVPGENHRPVASHWQTLSQRTSIRSWQRQPLLIVWRHHI